MLRRGEKTAVVEISGKSDWNLYFTEILGPHLTLYSHSGSVYAL